jgi:hypothetical protein
VLAAGEGLGGSLGLLGARFGVLDRAEVTPASSSPAAGEGRPRWDWFRRTGLARSPWRPVNCGIGRGGRRETGGLHGRPWGGGLRVCVQGSGA